MHFYTGPLLPAFYKNSPGCFEEQGYLLGARGLWYWEPDIFPHNSQCWHGDWCFARCRDSAPSF